MTSKVEICNLALIEARYDETIESLDENSVAAERCKRLYDTCRKEVLSNYPWTFAVKFEELARIGEDVEGHKFAYSYPKDCLRVLNMFSSADDYRNKNFRTTLPNNNRVAMFGEQKAVLVDSETPFAEYIYDEELEDNFSALFTRLLYLEIALRLAKLAGQSADDVKLIAAQIQEADAKARVQSVGEDDNHLNVEDNYYIDVRG